MGHLGAEPSRAHFAERAHVQALLGGALELLQLAAVEVEEAQCQRLAFALGVHQQLTPGAIGHLDAPHRGLHQDRLAGAAPRAAR